MKLSRGGGLLLHVSSLPSAYGVGDLGPEAFRFVDFLKAGKQTYWQILPLNQTEEIYGHSPYSSPSAFAGNTLFISPEILVKEGYLRKGDLKTNLAFRRDVADYSRAIHFRKTILKKAYRAFQKNLQLHQDAFQTFLKEQSGWLEDYALFRVLKKRFQSRSWDEWPNEFKKRDPEALKKIQKAETSLIEEIKFYQFLFFRQWHALKKYANRKGISIVGDIPIYLSYDSADVWAHPKLFKLKENLKPKFVAGVPPDYFSETGQRWGNPVYHWTNNRKQGYRWWLHRIGANLELYDYLRIDHFRGFVAYWQVPAEEETAVRGRWVRAPGRILFDTVKEQFPKPAIIAEDIGYITQPVKDLMKYLKFPGMKVFQFAFHDKGFSDDYLPRNYPAKCFAYTGTHDNNTIVGWYQEEISDKQRKYVDQYMRNKISPEIFHWQVIEMIYASKANAVIIPVQDVLGLGAEAKMNKPATSEGNWKWRLPSGSLQPSLSKKLTALVRKYRR